MPHKTDNQPPDPSERLALVWIVSTLVLLVTIAVVSLLVAGRLYQQGVTIQRLQERVVLLESRVADAMQPGLAPATQPAAPRVPRPTVAEPPAAPSPQTQRAELSVAEPEPAAPQAEPTVAEQVERDLARLLRPDAQQAVVVSDLPAAQELVRRALGLTRLDVPAAETWAGLALLALRTGEGASAEVFARRARDAGGGAPAYYELAGRDALAARDYDAARRHAGELMNLDSRRAASRLLLAEAWLAGPDPDVALVTEALSGVRDPRALSPEQRLRLGRLLVARERWEDLRILGPYLADVPSAQQSERDLLRAIVHVRDRRYVEAVAILDAILHDQPEMADALLWRGVALLESGAVDAARVALAPLERFPDYVEGWYWRAMVELRAGKTGLASSLLETALVARPRYTPAWEALAALALERRELDSAIENLQIALRGDPLRASAWLMLAITHARAGDPGAARGALQNALDIDPSQLEIARGADVLAPLLAEFSAPATQPAPE